MKSEEKQALINRILNIKTSGKANRFEITELAEIALAALTAQPVKQPQTHDAHGFPEPAHIINSRWIEAIRAAGYEVKE